MACVDCEERRKKLRDAILHGKMAEAVGLTVGGLREMIGFKSADADDHHTEEAAPAKTATKAK